MTTNPDRAHGIGQDLGGKGGRDIWRVRIHRDHLVQTNETPGHEDYQIVGGEGKVPIHSISPISLHEPKKEAVSWPRTLAILEELRSGPCT